MFNVTKEQKKQAVKYFSVSMIVALTWIFIMILSAVSVKANNCSIEYQCSITKCLDDTRLEVNQSHQELEQAPPASIEEHWRREVIICENGCNIDRCNDTLYTTEFSMTMSIFTLLLVLWAVFLIFGWHFKAPLFTILSGFFALIISIIIMTTGMTIDSLYYNNNYTLMIGMFFLALFFYIIGSEVFG